jgi:anthranilate/para-aminobenzoate synthase component I
VSLFSVERAAALRPLGGLFWLDSAGGPASVARASFLGAGPVECLETYGRLLRWWTPANGWREEEGDPFDALVSLWERARALAPAGRQPRPVCVGRLAYDLGALALGIELPRRANEPDLAFAAYPAVYRVDHGRAEPLSSETRDDRSSSGRAALDEFSTSDANPGRDADSRRAASVETNAPAFSTNAPAFSTNAPAFSTNAPAFSTNEENPRGERLSALGCPQALARLASSWNTRAETPSASSALLGYDSSEEEHRAMLQQAREHLLDGDIYQANLSIGLQASLQGDPLALYGRLREQARAPFCAYLEDERGAILSASMERFLSGRVEGDVWQVETRPIKGTRPRGATPAEDEAQRAALLASEKDRAEHVMIVDLERNDLGRAAQIGSVRVETLAAAIPYETVHHLESIVTARVPRSIGLAALLRATFPTGSITGAPKRRAMEIIAALEGKARGVYCGSIGYLDDHGGFDFSVAIRTAEARGERLSYRAGGGIVIDSDPAEEWRECAWKAEAFLRALNRSPR